MKTDEELIKEFKKNGGKVKVFNTIDDVPAKYEGTEKKARTIHTEEEKRAIRNMTVIGKIICLK